MSNNAFIFECSSTTYLDCVDKNLFGSNKPWPLQIKAGDYRLVRPALFSRHQGASNQKLFSWPNQILLREVGVRIREVRTTRQFKRTQKGAVVWRQFDAPVDVTGAVCDCA